MRRSAVMKPACAALATLSALSSPAITSAPPAFSAWQLASPEPPRPNTATVLPAKEVTGIMICRHSGARSTNPESNPIAARGPGMTEIARHHRSFSVERPASASITEMIQNRITICGSVQPFCSK